MSCGLPFYLRSTGLWQAAHGAAAFCTASLCLALPRPMQRAAPGQTAALWRKWAYVACLRLWPKTSDCSIQTKARVHLLNKPLQYMSHLAMVGKACNLFFTCFLQAVLALEEAQRRPHCKAQKACGASEHNGHASRSEEDVGEGSEDCMGGYMSGLEEHKARSYRMEQGRVPTCLPGIPCSEEGIRKSYVSADYLIISWFDVAQSRNLTYFKPCQRNNSLTSVYVYVLVCGRVYERARICSIVCKQLWSCFMCTSLFLLHVICWSAPYSLSTAFTHACLFLTNLLDLSGLNHACSSLVCATCALPCGRCGTCAIKAARVLTSIPPSFYPQV